MSSYSVTSDTRAVGGGGQGSPHSHLPRCHYADFKVFDKRRMVVGGWLKKKAGTSGGSLFNKGAWQRRWFSIDSEVTGTENYELEYYHYPDDKTPRQKFPLEGAALVMAGGTNIQVQMSDGTMLQLKAEDGEKRNEWYEMLEKVITVATLRAQAIQDRSHQLFEEEEALRAGDDEDDYFDPADPDAERPSPQYVHRNPFKIKQRANPLVRLDLDIGTIPPSSTQRRQFEEMFVSDVARALGVEQHIIEVISVKPAPNADWLVEVEFDVYIPPPSRKKRRGDRDRGEDDATEEDDYDDEDDEYEEEDDEDLLEEQQRERQEHQHMLLERLHTMVLNSTSPLYSGFITCKLDSSFCANMVEQDFDEDFFSSEPEVVNIMNKYKDTVLPANFIDSSHFEITVAYDGVEYPFYVPNPTMLRRRWCAVWPFEIKQTLGIMGTMQEQWVEPRALTPRDMPITLSQPIHFRPSVRYDGNVCISAIRLTPGVTYDVECDDLRSEVLENLTEEEKSSIQATFDKYDQNKNGSVSKFEIEELVRERTRARRKVVDDKFHECVSEEGISEEEVASAEESRRQALQQINEAQTKLIRMFDCADLNGDGVLSLTEFSLAEAWFMRCALNPEKQHLF